MSQHVGQTSPGEVTLDAIVQARERIRADIYYSPCAYSARISQAAKLDVYLKLENLQMTGSFKERGALNRILALSENERARGVIAASAGNHAQGVAFHATRHGIRSQIVMPVMTPLVKVNATKGYGAEVVLHGANYDEAYHEARILAERSGFVFIHPFDDVAVIVGQGTIALEILEQVSDVEAVVVPVGGGGLISGLACALKETRPSIRVIGVQAARMSSMVDAVKEHHPVTIDPTTTIADGIAVRRAGDLTVPLVERYVDEIVTVEEEEIASGILTLLEREKTLAEGAGAAAVAALLHHKTTLTSQRTVALVGGGNIDVSLLARIIQRGLAKDGRLVRLQIHLADRPGSLHQLTRLLTIHQANIVELHHDRTYYGVNLGDTLIDVTLEARGEQQIREILKGLEEEGYRHERIQ